MGCDIHCYIEFKKPKSDSWKDFGGRINPGRNYSMFGAMAGVRVDDIPHLEPKGVTDDMAYASSGDYWLFVTDSKNDSEGYCSVEQAERWLKSGCVLKYPENHIINNYVSHPDWHSHSSLTTNEFELAIAAYLKASGYQLNTPKLNSPNDIEAITTEAKGKDNAITWIAEYWAILAAMKCFLAQGFEARLVFWFDN